MLIIINKVVISNPNLPGYTSGGIRKLEEKKLYSINLILKYQMSKNGNYANLTNDLPGPRNDHKHGGWHVPSH